MNSQTTADDTRLGAGLVSDVMVRAPKTLPATATVEDAHQELWAEHVHMVLLCDGPRLAGTVVLDDLIPAKPGAPAMRYAGTRGRVVSADAPAEPLRRWMLATNRRRLAVVGPGAELLGLLCLQRHGGGFCSDEDVAARAEHRAQNEDGPAPTCG